MHRHIGFFETNNEGYIKALLGGSMMLLLPFILMTEFGNGLVKIMKY